MRIDDCGLRNGGQKPGDFSSLPPEQDSGATPGANRGEGSPCPFGFTLRYNPNFIPKNKTVQSLFPPKKNEILRGVYTEQSKCAQNDGKIQTGWRQESEINSTG